MRSRTNRRIAGVCGGIAESQGWDATLIRLAWVALVLFAGTGVLLYVILWIVLPEAPLLLPPGAVYPPPVYPGAPPYPPTNYPPGPTNQA